MALFGRPTLRNTPDVMNRFGTASGELVGGNLSILYSLLGSTSAIDCTDKILFIEDLDEYLYHIDHDDEFKTQWLLGKYKRDCWLHV
jgi:muramoyltetrapeptide carboxypeptidase